MYAPERQQVMLDEARRHGRVEVSVMADRFDITKETVRRDLTALERRGVIRRVHGGAIPITRLGFEPSLSERLGVFPNEKARIAKAALDELPQSGSIAFDAGTTIGRLVETLPTDRTFTVITHSPPLAAVLSPMPNITLHMAGGVVRNRTQAAIGPWAERIYAEVHVDVAFLGANAITAEHGVSTPDIEEANVKRVLIESAQRLVVLADHSKLGHNEFSLVCPIEAVDTLITDSAADPDLVSEITERGVRVILA